MQTTAAQPFATNFAAEAAFETGLRSYFAYRDLGSRESTSGLLQAHVLRATGPSPAGGTGWHHHEVDFQMVYVLAGSITTELGDAGAVTFTAGDCWTQPPGLRHCVREYSADLTLIELISPADFGTVEAEPAQPRELTQALVKNFAADSPYAAKGLRSFWEYRDLGIAKGTGGAVRAQVLRPTQPCPEGGTGWHYHEVDYQFFYVLQGSLTTHVADKGIITFNGGDSWTQPAGTRHCVLNYSQDLELLEVIAPADFGTVECPPAG